MNQGVLQSSPLQQMMAGSPNWYCYMNNMKSPPSHELPPPSSFLASPTNLYPQFTPPPPPPPSPPSSSTSLQLPSSSSNDHNQELPESWGQLLLGGLVREEDKSGVSAMGINWERQLLHDQIHNTTPVDDVNRENPLNSYVYGHGDHVDQFQAKAKSSWSSQMMPAVSSPKSCIDTALNRDMLDFSSKSDASHQPPDYYSSECNGTPTGGAAKKARVQHSSTQSTFKVRKEKLGDRITALHQLVSPFGKTDTASVLLEAIGYIRFLQSQIQALSLPYLGTASGNMRQQQQQQQNHVQGDRNCLFPEDPSQEECYGEAKKDLKSRGLCLVPIPCTMQVGSESGADYWASQAFGRGF